MPDFDDTGREQVLDAAERLLAECGAASITLKAVARTAAVPEAHVRTLFGNKDRLVNALFARWESRQPSTFVSVDMPAYPVHAVHNHFLARTPFTRADYQVTGCVKHLKGFGVADKSIHLRIPEASDLRAHTLQERRTRIATLAAEGALRLRDDAGVQIDADLWSEIFDDLRMLLGDDQFEIIHPRFA